MSDVMQTTNNPLAVLAKGKILARPETWKALQNLINLLSGLAPTLLVFFPQYHAYLTPEFFATLGASIAAINAYLTTATTAKIGL